MDPLLVLCWRTMSKERGKIIAHCCTQVTRRPPGVTFVPPELGAFAGFADGADELFSIFGMMEKHLRSESLPKPDNLTDLMFKEKSCSLIVVLASLHGD